MTTASNEGGSASSLPPDEAQWISSVAAAIRTALDDPSVQAEIVGLLCGDEERRARRLRELAMELDGKELTLKLWSDDAATTEDPD